MIYLFYIILITTIISNNKMLIMYHMSSRETNLSNIHLNMTRISACIPLTLCSDRDYHLLWHYLGGEKEFPTGNTGNKI